MSITIHPHAITQTNQTNDTFCLEYWDNISRPQIDKIITLSIIAYESGENQINSTKNTRLQETENSHKNFDLI